MDYNNLNVKSVSLDFRYKWYQFHIDTLPNFFKSHNFEIVITSKNFKKKYQNKKIKFIYFVIFFVRLDNERMRKDSDVGTLHPVLQTKDFIIYKSKK